jgi:hypothetical protein
MVPQNIVSVDGGTPITGDLLNTYVQTVSTFADLRDFNGVAGMQVLVLGGFAVNDGLQGGFYWNAGAINPVDDDANTIVPFGAGQGCWSRISGAGAVSMVIPSDGDTLTATVGLAGYILDPVAALNTLTINLPPTPSDQQTFEVSTTQDITALTANAPGGVSVMGGDGKTLAANGGQAWRYIGGSTRTWFRRY